MRPGSALLPPLLIRPFVFGLTTRPRTRVNEEVSRVLWLPLAELPGRAGTAVVQAEGSPREVPCFKAGGAVIWGLTYRILSGFLPLAV